MDVFWDFVGFSAAVLTSLGFTHQIIRGIKTKKMEDVSAEMLVVLAVGLFLWLLYGIHLNNLIMVGANCFGLFSVVVTLYLKLKYSKK